MEKLKYLLKVLYFAVRYIAHSIVRLMWNFSVTFYQALDYAVRRITVFVLKIVWNELVNITVILRALRRKIIKLKYGLTIAFKGIAAQPAFMHYFSVTAGVLILFVSWICIDFCFRNSKRLDVLAFEMENSVLLNDFNNKSFEAVSFYINDPVDVPEMAQTVIPVAENKLVDEIESRSFFEGKMLVAPATSAIGEKDLPHDAKEEEPEKEVSEQKTVDNQAGEEPQQVLPDKDKLEENAQKSNETKEEVLEKTGNPVLKSQQQSDDEIEYKEVRPVEPVNAASDKLKESKKYTDSIEKRKKNAYLLFLKGRVEAERGNSQAAIEMMEKAKLDDPHEAELLYYLGICYCRIGEYAKGIENLEEAYNLIIDPNILVPVKNAHFMLGLKQAKNQDYQSALKSFNRVIEIDPDDGRAFFNRGICYITSENYDQALSDFDNAEAKDFTCLELKLNRAIALDKKGETQKAIGEYKLILHEQPLYAPAHYNIAVLFEDKIIKTGEYDRYAADAIYHYKRALELDRSFYEASFNISRIYYAMDEVTMSIKWLKKCIELNSNFPEAHLFLAKLYLEKGAYNNALAQVEKMEKLGYDFKELNQMREEIFQICGIKEIDNE